MTAIAACRTCGTEPLENARFCHGSGSPVQDGDTRAEYKQVTVLFADAVHSMEIAAAVGPARLREVHGHQQGCRRPSRLRPRQGRYCLGIVRSAGRMSAHASAGSSPSGC